MWLFAEIPGNGGFKIRVGTSQSKSIDKLELKIMILTANVAAWEFKRKFVKFY